MSEPCLLPDKVEEFKKALKDKELDMADLLNLDHADLVKTLEPYAGKNAKEMATLLEGKRILKNRMRGLTNFLAKETQSGKYSPENVAKAKQALAEFRAKQSERIFNPKEGESYLGGIVEKLTGQELPKEVAQKVYQLQKELDNIKEKGAGFSGVSDEYLQKNNELNDYIKSFEPSSPAKTIATNLATWGRNMLLANPATPIKAAENQTVNSAIDAVTRRIASWSLKGLNSDLVKQANKEAWQTFKKTGMNTAGMENMDDTHLLGKGENFNLPTDSSVRKTGKIEQATSALAKWSNRLIINWAHNIPFTKFYQKTFFDMANFLSSHVAESEGLKDVEAKNRAAEILRDSARIEPQTAEGAMVRLESQRQAARVTSSNETWASKMALGIKKGLNSVPGFPLGDFIMPIAKIPASVIANGFENAGFGIPKGAYQMYQGYQKIQSDDMGDKYEGMGQFKDGIQTLIRTVGSMGLAFYLASKFSKDDFRKDNYGNTFVKIGNTWINMEYFAAISPAFAGAMNVKQGKGYISGTATGLMALPGLSDAQQLVTALSNGKFGQYAKTFFTSRGEPAFVSNILKDRPIDRLLFGATGVESTEQYSADQRAAAEKRKK